MQQVILIIKSCFDVFIFYRDIFSQWVFSTQFIHNDLK